MAFKEIILNITIKRDAYKYCIDVNENKNMTLVELSKVYEIPESLVRSHMNKDTKKEFTKWMQNYLEIKSLGLASACVLFKRGGDVCWTTCLTKTSGFCHSAAHNKLKQWESGIGDLDTLFDPRHGTHSKSKNVKSKWGDLGNSNREYNLSKLKKPGTWEVENASDNPMFHKDSSNPHVVGKSTSLQHTIYRGD